MHESIAALLIVLALVAFAALASRFGVDSRDGADWSPPGLRASARR